MATTVQTAPPIGRGYPYTFRMHCSTVEGEAAPFPVGCTLLADLAGYAGGKAVASLTTEGGEIDRIDDNTVEIRLSGVATAALTNNRAMLDLVRTDSSPDTWMGLRVELSVQQPVTVARPNS